MVLRRTPALTKYSCEEFPSRTTWCCLLLRKDKIRPHIWHKFSSDLSLWRRPACQTLLRALCMYIYIILSIYIYILYYLYILYYIILYYIIYIYIVLRLGSPRPMKSPNNSTRYICQKICSWSRRPKTIFLYSNYCLKLTS